MLFVMLLPRLSAGAHGASLRRSSSASGSPCRGSPSRASTCCSIRSIRRSPWRRSTSAARRSPSCAPSASAREIRGAFGLYLSPDQVEQVARNPELLQLGGEQREITVMFTDVRGFTRISEQFDPHGLTRFMNRFLTPMTDLIQEHQRHDRQVHGRRDHGVLECAARRRPATPRAPARPRSPCRRSCATLNAEWQAEAEAEGRQHIPVAIGIGLNTGQASVGNFGSTQRLHLFLPGRRREPRLAAGRAVQDLRRRHHHRREDPRSRWPTSPRSSSTSSW